MITDQWADHLNLETPTGKVLNQLARSLPKNRPFRITLFGSAPLQIGIEPALLSGDINLFSDEEWLAEWVRMKGFGDTRSRPYIQVCSELNFRTSPRWRGRTRSIEIANCTFILPHPIDILIAKLNRLEEKDLLAFRVVREKTGHPTEAELIEELQMAVDLFRPGFDEENAADLANNTHRLWPLFYGREIDVRREIIAPALVKRRAGYDLPTRDYKQELRDAVAAYDAAHGR